MLCSWDTSGKPPHELQKDEVAQTCKKHQSEHWKFPQQMMTLKNKLTVFLSIIVRFKIIFQKWRCSEVSSALIFQIKNNFLALGSKNETQQL